jgi:hypothetical protein
MIMTPKHAHNNWPAFGEPNLKNAKSETNAMPRQIGNINKQARKPNLLIR